MTKKNFASTGDMAEKTISFSKLGEGLYAYTAEGDPNTGVIVGDDSCMVIDAQATPLMAKDVIARVAKVTDKPIKYVLLSHYHAVRVLGASAFNASEIIASDVTRNLIVERGEQDKASEIGRFPRLFRGVESVPPGMTWPTLTFKDRMTLLAREAARRHRASRARSHRRRHHRVGSRQRRDVFRRPRRIQIRLLLRRRAFPGLAEDARSA